MSTFARRLRWVALPVAAAAALFGVGACSSGDDDAPAAAAPAATAAVDLSAVTLKVGDQKAGIQAALEASGQLKDIPYKIEWSQFASGPPLLEALTAKAIDIGGVGETPPIFTAAAGVKITLVGAYQAEVTGSAIVVPKDSPIKALGDLKGKKIAVAKGSSAHYHLLAALTKAGLTFDDIEPAYLQPPDALAAFGNGSVDAWAIWDPYTAVTEKLNGAQILVDGSGGLTTGLAFQVSRPDVVADPGKAAAIRDLLIRVGKARQWALAHADTWAEAWGKEAGVPVEIAKIYVDRADTRAVVIDDPLIARVQKVADAFTDAKIIPVKVDISSLATDQFNDTVALATAG
ncbi:ABC transporter substrate-binding protein [Frankia sp. CNm7]|uniref:Putative aliphatic sulfonates-binding protein n=1 Tax=Frankia nepalensis TaxID=1836974 RepID=A0A937URG2_9ACTN|nr:ABC transporter substrate-binding protein [Frankia nepalensis]MBL7495390.1 ABC transporter substrate-binding protein [Frankia nepalensis]MBL7516176.1 ABC transporter substrate-binding protein [Frankia nepalensis]MBL7520039.1 ABC transporter substrate-binding protein [Frankia nepalensis]MBL7627721.1 ABC transporter substrate-binding protein [Frankia nepalensis]